jgi:hypothetical protein
MPKPISDLTVRVEADTHDARRAIGLLAERLRRLRYEHALEEVVAEALRLGLTRGAVRSELDAAWFAALVREDEGRGAPGAEEE